MCDKRATLSTEALVLYQLTHAMSLLRIVSRVCDARSDTGEAKVPGFDTLATAQLSTENKTGIAQQDDNDCNTYLQEKLPARPT